jgi:L-2,4-diaminobutyrate decarboxylase
MGDGSHDRAENQLESLFLPPGGDGRLFEGMLVEASRQIVAGLTGAPAFPSADWVLDKSGPSAQLAELLSESFVPSAAQMFAIGRDLIRGSVPLSNPLVAGHLQCPTMLPAIVAEVYIAALNQSLDSFDQAPVAGRWELAVIDLLVSTIGFPATGSGVFTSGGTESNLMAMIAARETAAANDADMALTYVLCSDQAHFSVGQASRVLGLRSEQVVLVPTTKGQLDIGHVSRCIERRAALGWRPMMILGTTGTTSMGTIEPVKELTEIARSYDAWMHIDAAYGAGMLFAPSRPNWSMDLAGADSISIDFHKMLMQPIPCSAFVVRDARLLAAFASRADYLNREEDEVLGYVNLVDRSLKTTRSFDALKVVFTLAAVGRVGIARAIGNLESVTASAEARINGSDLLDLYCDPALTTIVFGPSKDLCLSPQEKGRVITAVRHRLLRDGTAVIGEIQDADARLWKITFVNPLASYGSVDQLIGLVEAGLASELANGT